MTSAECILKCPSFIFYCATLLWTSWRVSLSGWHVSSYRILCCFCLCASDKDLEGAQGGFPNHVTNFIVGTNILELNNKHGKSLLISLLEAWACTCKKEKGTNKQQSNAKLGDDLIELLKYLASAALIGMSSLHRQ